MPFIHHSLAQVNPIKVMVADDHDALRQLFVKILSREEGIRVCAEVTCGTEVLNELSRTDIDVLLLDLSMPPPHGLELVSLVGQRFPTVCILVISMHNSPGVAKVALNTGAKGYITKDCDASEIVHALREVSAGRTYIEKRILEAITISAVGPSNARLTPMEVRLLRLLSDGITDREAAHDLFISERTFQVLKSSVMAKLGIDTHTGLVMYASKNLAPVGRASPPQ